jgi:GlpG protein
MRSIGAVSTEHDARRFSSHLLTLGISSQCDPAREGFCIWIRDEDQLDRARQELSAYLANPADPRYDQAVSAADQIRARQVKAEKEHRKNVRNVRAQWRRPVPQGCPLTIGLIAACVLIAAVSALGNRRYWDKLPLNMLFVTAPFREGDSIFARTDFPEIRQGQVWRLVTPIFIHFGPIHLLFNLWNLYSLGGVVETVRGRWRYAVFVVITAILSNATELVWSDQLMFGGMSGVLYALFGYVWMKSRYDPSAGMYLNPDTVMMMIMWLFLCMTGLVGNIANGAHVGGLVSGVVIGIAPVLWRRFWKYFENS